MTKERAKELLKTAAGMLEWDLTLELQEAVEMACKSLDEQEEKYRYLVVYKLPDCIGHIRIDFPNFPTEDNIDYVEKYIQKRHNTKENPIIINLIKIQ